MQERHVHDIRIVIGREFRFEVSAIDSPHYSSSISKEVHESVNEPVLKCDCSCSLIISFFDEEG